MHSLRRSVSRPGGSITHPEYSKPQITSDASYFQLV
jgi:hypothetical protein